MISATAKALVGAAAKATAASAMARLKDFNEIMVRMGATHFLMKTLPKVAAEMALHVLAYNMTRVMNLVGVKPLMAAIRP